MKGFLQIALQSAQTEHAEIRGYISAEIKIALLVGLAACIGAEQRELLELMTLCNGDGNRTDFIERIDVLPGCGGLCICQRGGCYRRKDDLTVALINSS